jgi:predicted porin
MRRTLVFALGLVGLAATAHAADMDLLPLKAPPFKDPLPDSLSWQGFTFYATVDFGYAYQTNGRPLGSVVSGLEFIPFTTTRNYTGQAISTIAHSGLEQSKAGLKFEREIGYNWALLADLGTGFNPLSGKLSDGCSSFIQNAGVPYAQQTSNADSGRCGQTFNGPAYGGFSNPAYGTLTVGRQNTFQLDGIAAYDPMALSYAFSLLGYSGTNAGSGTTQSARWDNSAKYVYRYGPVHAGVMYSEGGDTTGMFGKGFGFNVGGSYRGFSLDGVYTREHGAVGLQSAVNDPLGTRTLAANISDNEGWSLLSKYTYAFAGARDEDPRAKLTFYGGYTHIDQSNPQNPVLFGSAAGGYPLTLGPGLPDNDAFTADRILQYFWTGAKYELPSGWSFTGAYYHANQNSFVADHKPCVAGGASRTDCAGNFDQVSLLADYQITKHFDVYAGITYARVTNGLASGFPGTPGAIASLGPPGTVGTATSVNTTSIMTGVRMKL